MDNQKQVNASIPVGNPSQEAQDTGGIGYPARIVTRVNEFKIRTRGDLLAWLRFNHCQAFSAMHSRGWKGCKTWEEVLIKLAEIHMYTVIWNDAPKPSIPERNAQDEDGYHQGMSWKEATS